MVIARYTRERIGRMWSDKTKYEKWLEIEKAVLLAKAELRLIPRDVVKTINANAEFTVIRIEEIEKEVEHDMLAFIMAVQENLPPGVAGEFHKGLTSYDVEEPAMILQIREAIEIILPEIEYVSDILTNKAIANRWTEIAFRTHGQIAELGTLGIKFLRWLDLFERSHRHLTDLAKEINVCKLSGAVGTYSSIGPEVEKETAKILEMEPARIASQILSRDYHARVINELAILASAIEQIALEIRLHSQSGIDELQEPFKEKQKGSSAMPHKRNPILCERLCGLARVARSYAIVAMENIATWDERDISHSGPERIILPDAFILTDYMLAKLAYILDGLQVFPKKMKENIEETYGTLFSQQIKVFLLEKGVNPEVAYRLVQESSFKAIAEKRHISEIVGESLVFKDLDIDIKELKESCFDPKFQLKHIDEIYARFNL